MAAINKHGHKMVGLKAASSETKGLGGYYSPEYVEMFYNRNTGEIRAKYQYSLGHNTFTVIDDDDTIRLGNVCSPMTMQEIADMIGQRLSMVCDRPVAM